MNLKKVSTRLLLLGGILVGSLYGCQPEEVGFISDSIYYRVNPFPAPQGKTVYSAPLELDGSSSPLSVRLLAVRNKATGQPADSLLKEFETQQFNGVITRADSTMELLYRKLIIKPMQVLRISPLGGRIEVAASSASVASGTYEIDLEVTNTRGTKQLLKACDVVIAPTEQVPYTVNGSFGSTSLATEESDFQSITLTTSVNYLKNGKNQLAIKIVDRNNVPFNVAKGEVVRRGDRGHFAQMNPYFPTQQTDSAMVWQVPYIETGFPIFGGNNGFLSYYRIPAAFNQTGRNVNVTLDNIKMFLPGTYVVTIKLNTIARKN